MDRVFVTDPVIYIEALIGDGERIWMYMLTSSQYFSLLFIDSSLIVFVHVFFSHRQ